MLMAVTDATEPDGRLLDSRYRLGASLGSGGVAEVVRATDERLQREVAIKLFRGDVAAELQRHEAEMQTLARLDHPGLVTVFDAGTDDSTGQPYLVMQLVEGSTLADELQGGPLSPRRTAQIGESLSGALDYVHRQGLVHRDVKPANVLISYDGRVSLADFGIARLVDSAHVTRTGDVLGTPAYFAPEQVAGEAVGPAADVYALGLVLLECLKGRREFEGPPMEAAMARLSKDPLIPARLPAVWQDLLAAMTARSATRRVSAADAHTALSRLAIGDERTVAMPATVRAPMPTQVMPPMSVAAPAPVVVSPQRRSGVRPWLVVLMLLIVAAVAVGIVIGVQRNDQGSATDCFSQSPAIGTASVSNDSTLR